MSELACCPPGNAKHRDLLTATKWLGNAGSRYSKGQPPLTKDDVMDSIELVAHLLEELYAPSHEAMAAVAKKVNKKKGPVR